MTKKILTAVLLLVCFVSFSQTKKAPIKMKNKYDADMARRLGADEFGMKNYVVCFLKTGPNKTISADSSEKIKAAHLKHLGKLASKGKLVVGGPFVNQGELEGMLIFNVDKNEEAEELAKADPAVKAGMLVMELHPWYGTAGLVEVPVIHSKIHQKLP